MTFDPDRERWLRRVRVEPSEVLRAALAEPSASKRFLRRELPESWRFAHQMTMDLVRQVEFLAWADRANAFDTYLLRQGEAMLQSKGLTQLVTGPLVEGLTPDLRRELDDRAHRFASWSRATVSAVLLELDERPEVVDAHQALTYLLARELSFARAAAGWTGEYGMGPVEAVLRRLPGYALVLLASSPNDTAERFLARDAFWAAVLGQ